MKHDPDSRVRSQRELMQPYQLRLPKETIRDIQILRVFAGIKVSEELRDLVIKYVDDHRHLVRQAAQELMPEFDETDAEQRALLESGEAELVRMTPVAMVEIGVDEQGNRTVTREEIKDAPTTRRVQRKRT